MRRILSVLAFLMALMLSVSAFASPEMLSEQTEVRAIKLFNLVTPYYDASIEVAVNSPGFGRDFTDHKIKHAMMVVEKSVDFSIVLKEAVESGSLPTYVELGRVGFSSEIDPLVMEAAAIFHDTGMCGLGYAPVPVTNDEGEILKDEYGHTVLTRDPDGWILMLPENRDDFQTVRTYHSLNSALFTLASREELLSVGYSDFDVDLIAAACQAHSKSSSGVRDMNSRTDWAYAFDLLDSIVHAWNEDYPDYPISFSREPFETPDSDALSRLVSMTLALRVGDVSRDSEPDAEVQTGETVHVDRSTLNNFGGSWEAELENAVITIGENNDPVVTMKARQVHAGEQNIVENTTYLTSDHTVAHCITVEDGCSAPGCTQLAVNDHLGEFASAPEGNFLIDIRFNHFDDTEDGYFRTLWESYRLMAMEDFTNVSIIYPWDNEDAPAVAGASGSVTLHPYSLPILDETFDGLYTGEMQDGAPEGYGIFVVAQPDEGHSWHYIGSWKNGVMDGEGATYWENGSLEIGTYKEGRLILGYFNYDGVRLKIYRENESPAADHN